MLKGTHRREFSAGAAGALGVMIVAPRQVRGSQANSALSIGLLGCGNRGMHDAGIASKNEFARIAAFCDIYDDKIAEARKRWSGAKAFKKAEELMASDVDAVLIATPAVFHPEHFEMAVKARKHIFMEKPAAVDSKGCRRIVEAAKKADKSKRITVDFQQRYGKDYRKAYEIVKSGELGGIKMIRAAWLGNGPRPKSGHAASEEKIRNWYFYKDMSGDILIEQDCHNIDVVNWFAGEHPVKASGYGSRMIRTSPGDVLDNLSATFQFANGLVFNYSAHQFGPDGYQDVSETFMCEKGWVNVSRKGYTLSRGAKSKLETVETKYDITQDAINEFIDGARNGKIENAAFHAADSTLTAIMAREAIYSGREMTWDRVTRM